MAREKNGELKGSRKSSAVALGGIFSLSHLLEPVESTYGDVALLVCAFCTGMLDGASFVNFGVFVGMQTGNTVILGVSSADLPTSQPHATVAAVVSICSFFIGALTTYIFARLSNKLIRMTPSLSLFIQALFIVLAAALTTSSIVPQDPEGNGANLGNIRIVVPIPPLAFQSGMQIATSRLLGFNELPTTVLTSTYADLAGDQKLLALSNRKRDRRVGAVVAIVTGAIVSGWIIRGTGKAQVVMWICVGLKAFAALGLFLFLRPVQPHQKARDQADIERTIQNTTN